MLAQVIRKPDVRRYQEHEETEGEFKYGLFCQAESLILGALAIAERGMEENEDLDAIYELLSAFNAVMETGSKTLDGAKRKPLPRLTVDEFKELLGAVGGAEVEIRVDRNGDLGEARYYVGRKYTIGSEGGKGVLIEIPFGPEKSSGKKNGNGKAKGKAA